MLGSEQEQLSFFCCSWFESVAGHWASATPRELLILSRADVRSREHLARELLRTDASLIPTRFPCTHSPCSVALWAWRDQPLAPLITPDELQARPQLV